MFCLLKETILKMGLERHFFIKCCKWFFSNNEPLNDPFNEITKLNITLGLLATCGRHYIYVQDLKRSKKVWGDTGREKYGTATHKYVQSNTTAHTRITRKHNKVQRTSANSNRNHVFFTVCVTIIEHENTRTHTLKIGAQFAHRNSFFFVELKFPN